MASLLAPPLVPGTPDLPYDYEFSKPAGSRSLLNLDCSKDLTPYSRSLGPSLPDRKTPINNETVRAHIEDHREQVLRSRESTLQPGPQGQAQAQAQTLGYPPSSHSHASVPTNIHGPTPRPQPAQFLLQRPLSTAPPTPALPRSRSLAPGDINTYPHTLRAALDQSSRHPVELPYSNVVYQVIEHIDSRYVDESTEVVATYANLHSTNLKAAEYFVDNYSGCFHHRYNEPEFNLHRDGSLELKMDIHGPNGGIFTVWPVYKSVFQANIAAVADFLSSSGIFPATEGEEKGSEDKEEDSPNQEAVPDHSEPTRVAKEPRWVELVNGQRELSAGDVGWGFSSKGAVHLWTKQDVISGADPQAEGEGEGEGKVMMEEWTIVAVERQEVR
ncbi:hypothetical protein K504DRAFT_533264 [Pleomassaria siparia CBS 279.74]|uniref:Uncharacterized protein n=1 Tax=Pleomassaria siparia CBS 279.74 TaxID=1314801 RepID=A0A6G1KBW9_9PLEO|nr:hypothetical protein K504DRAFT_533264 [Pleomassaria siparia CBS 279.74]